MASNNRPQVSRASVEKAISVVAFWHGIDPSLIRDSNRRAGWRARRDVIRSVYRPGVSMASIGRRMGMHHTAILHALGRIKPKTQGAQP